MHGCPLLHETGERLYACPTLGAGVAGFGALAVEEQAARTRAFGWRLVLHTKLPQLGKFLEMIDRRKYRKCRAEKVFCEQHSHFCGEKGTTYQKTDPQKYTKTQDLSRNVQHKRLKLVFYSL